MYKSNLLNDRSGVSPVISVVLIVAVVVALVAVASVVVFNISDSSSTQDSLAGGSVDLTATSDGVRVRLIRQGDAEGFIVKVDGNEVGERLTNAGDTTTVEYEGLYTVAAQFSNGDEEVILTKEVSGVLNGLFTVFQDPEAGTAEAQLVERYQNDDSYTIRTVSNNENGGSTTSLEGGDQDGKLLSQQSPRLVQSGLPDRVPQEAVTVVGIGSEASEQSEPVQVGESAQLHKMMGSWCEGDDILLVGEDGQTVLDGDEFSFDNNCGGLQTFATFDGTEIDGVRLINRGNSQLDYTMYAYRGVVEPPRVSVIGDNPSVETEDIDVKVYQQQNSNEINTNEPISDAKVVVGNKAGTTDSSGTLGFEGIPEGESYFITVNAAGYEGTQIPITVTTDGSGNVEYELNDQLDPGNPFEAPDNGVYAEYTNGTLEVGMEEFTQNFEIVQSDPIPSGDTVTVDYSSAGINTGAGTNVALSAGSSSQASYGSSYTGGSVGGGASFYSGGGGATRSTQTLQTNTKGAISSSDYQAAPANSDVTQDQASLAADEPTRVLQTGEIDESSIISGNEIEIQASARTYSEQEVTDTVEIYRAPINDGSTGDLTPIRSVDVTLPPGTDGNAGNSVTINEAIVADSSNDLGPGKEYGIYVSLASVGNPQEAGTINVIDESLTDLQIDTAQVSADLSTGTVATGTDDLSEATVGDDLTLTLGPDTIKDSNGDPLGTSQTPTVDIYRNGDLVKRINDYDGSEYTYTDNLDEAQYVDYHVGIKESAETALIGTAVVQEEKPVSAPTFEVNLNTDTCTSDLTDNNYDCEINAGGDVNFGVGGTFGDSVDNASVNYDVNFGQGVGQESGDYSGGDTEYTKTYNEDGTYLVQLNATYDYNGETVTDLDTATVNVVTDLSTVTSGINGGSSIDGSEEFQIDIESDRSTTNEEVDVVVRSDVANAADKNVDGAYTISNFEVRGGVTETVRLSVPEIAYNDSDNSNDIYTGSGSQQEAIAALTASDGTVPLSVELVPVSGSVDADGDENLSFQINPDGQIEADISADVIVNPRLTFSSTDDGDGSITITHNNYDTYDGTAGYIVKDPSGSELTTSDEITVGNTQTEIATSAGTHVIEDGSGNVVREVYVSNP